MNDLSLLTVVNGKSEYLYRMLQGVAAQLFKPREMVVVFLNASPPASIPDPGCPVYLHRFPEPDEPTPIAAARNFAASVARGRLLIFLDAECVPGPHCMQRMAEAIRLTQSLIIARMVELPTLPDSRTYGEAVDSPPTDEPLSPVPYEDFQSCCFGLRASDYARIGGYDEHYRGYGPEDTDFAFSARKNKLSLLRCDGYVYRQPGTASSDFSGKLKEIVTNAASFYHKWQLWPMTGLLQRLEHEGLIRRSKHDIKLTRQGITQQQGED